MRQELPHIYEKSSVFPPVFEEEEGEIKEDSLFSRTSPSRGTPISCVLIAPKRRRGAQPGNTQALKTGRYSAENRALLARVSKILRRMRVHTQYLNAWISASRTPRPRS